jgi:protein arginine N-methyltransferase 1
MARRASKGKRALPPFTLELHETLLGDRLRTRSYWKAIENSVRPSDVVVDIGCGSGILTFFAARKGCRKIYAVDDSAIIDCAEETARRNNLHHNIEFIRKDILKFAPEEKVDVLIHEQIGSLLWDEDILKKVSYVRDNFLKKTGRILPAEIDLYLAPSNYPSRFEKSMSFWSKKRYGIDFGNFRRELLFQNFKAAMLPSKIGLPDRKTFLCKEKLVHTVDLWKATRVPSRISARFLLKRNSRLTGICAFFRVHLDEKTSFSTGPRKNNTHWGQIFLPCVEGKRLQQDSTLVFTLFPGVKGSKWKWKFAIQPC